MPNGWRFAGDKLLPQQFVNLVCDEYRLYSPQAALCPADEKRVGPGRGRKSGVPLI